MWISNYLFPIQCVYMWSQHKWPGEGNAALLVDFIKTWVLKFLEPQYTWEVFSSASSHIKHKQSLREMCGTQTSGGGWGTGQFAIHRRKKKKDRGKKRGKGKKGTWRAKTDRETKKEAKRKGGNSSCQRQASTNRGPWTGKPQSQLPQSEVKFRTVV